VSGPAPGPAPDVGSSRLAQARRRVAAAFSGDGELATAVAGFSPRASQQAMALAVFDTIVERGTLVAEAGTGTGKTFAYLVPALLAGGKVLVSTGTKTLQDQVYAKDVAALVGALGLRIDAALLKGRQNYLCLQRLARAEADGRLASPQEAQHLRAIGRFAQRTGSGDRAELSEVPRPPRSGRWSLRRARTASARIARIWTNASSTGRAAPRRPPTWWSSIITCSSPTWPCATTRCATSCRRPTR